MTSDVFCMLGPMEEDNLQINSIKWEVGSTVTYRLSKDHRTGSEISMSLWYYS